MAMKLIKSGKFFKVYQNGDDKAIMIENVRMSYPYIGHPSADESDSGETTHSYRGVPMLPMATHLDAKNAFMEIVNELLTKNDAKVAPENRCIKKGDDSEQEEYAGHWVISAKESRRPVARDKRGKLILDPEKVKDGNQVDRILSEIDDIFYGGVTVNILLRPWYFGGKTKKSTKTFPKRICCGLMAIQHVEDTPSFGQGRIDDTGIFGDTTGGEDDGDDPMAAPSGDDGDDL